MFPQLNKIKALPGCMLRAEFKDGLEVVYDVSGLVEVNPVFGELVRDSELFAKVRIDPGGYGISWNDELDLETEELWNCGDEVKSSFNLAKNLPSKDSENEPPPRPASAGSQSGSAG